MTRKIDMNLAVKGKNTDIINMQIRKVTIPLTYFLGKHTKIQPWHLVHGNILVMLFALFALAVSGYTTTPYGWRFFGALMVFVTVIIDHLDGKLARVLGKTSLYGKWIDTVPNFIFTPLIFIALALGLPGIVPWGITALAALCWPMHFLFVYYWKADFVPLLEKEKIDMVQKESIIRYLYGLSWLHIMLVLTALVNYPQFTIWFFAVFGNLFWFGMLGLQVRAILRYQKRSK